MKNRLFLLGSFLLITSGISGQKTEEIDIERFIEDHFQLQEENISYEDLYESLLQRYTTPLNINKASSEDLASLYVLTPIQIKSIHEHIAKHGRLISVYELQSIRYIDQKAIQKLKPFITVEDYPNHLPLSQRIDESERYIILRGRRTLQSERGFAQNEFAGDQNQVYGRLRIHRRQDFSLGITFEKDPGESVDFGGKNGFDFYSSHFMLERIGAFDKVIVGDYQAQFGQGLVYGSGFGVGKGSETVTTTKRNNLGILPYTSVLESGFFRGSAISFGWNPFKVTFLYSRVNQDARVISDSTYSDFDEFANSIQSTGLHRTTSELAARNQINEQAGGIIGTIRIGRNSNFGVTTLFNRFSKPLQKRPNTYNQFEFKGDENLLASVFYSSVIQNFNLFGEAARSSSGGIGGVGGIIASLSPKVDFSYVYRHYQKNFHSFYGNALSEGSRLINEVGNYWGLKLRPLEHQEIALYYDRFRFPWLRFRAQSPSTGTEFFVRWTHEPSEKIAVFIQFRQENKERDATLEGSTLKVLTMGKKRNFAFDFRYLVNENINLKTRIQGSEFEILDKRSSGFAIHQDINIAFWKIRLSGRLAIIDSEDFDNRQYLYERNVLYAFSVPSFSDLATRRYILLKYVPFRNVDLEVRWAETLFQDTNTIISGTIGSGLNTIEGARKTEITAQTRVRF